MPVSQVGCTSSSLSDAVPVLSCVTLLAPILVNSESIGAAFIRAVSVIVISAFM